MTEPLYYADDQVYDVVMADQVDVDVEQIPAVLRREADAGTYSGTVTKIHAAAREVTVRYDRGDTFRTSGKPIMRTERFSIDRVELVARDG